MIMNNKVYDVLKYIAMVFLPALATLYGTLASIWGLPYGQEVVATISAIDLFLGALLGISAKKYNKPLCEDDLVYDPSEPTATLSSEDGEAEPIADDDEDGGGV